MRIRLTQMTKSAGGAAKLRPGILSEIVGKLPKYTDEKPMVGFMARFESGDGIKTTVAS